MEHLRRSWRFQAIRLWKSYDSILPGCAALDLGATKIFAAAPATPVKTFGTFTGELRALSAWLTEHQIHSVAMESSGAR